MSKPLTPQELERYRRFVAALPCANCGLIGCTQAAHYSSMNKFNRGASIKAHDFTTFSLCHEGGRDCHGFYDRGRMFASFDLDFRGVLESEWALSHAMNTLTLADEAGLFRIPK